jgi:hypothetical protein
MKLKIKFPAGSVLGPDQLWDVKVALAVAGLVTPVSVLVIVVSLWGVLADTGVAGQFLSDAGIWSHWQVWLASGLLLQALVICLERYSRMRQRLVAAKQREQVIIPRSFATTRRPEIPF